MKVKLLKYTRNHFRILKNKLGHKKLQEKWVFIWWNYNNSEETNFAYHELGRFILPNVEGILTILHCRYRKYSKRGKIEIENYKKSKIFLKNWYL